MRFAKRRLNENRGVWPRISLLAILALTALLTASMIQSPRTLAAGTDPIIHWDSNMIYPGQNSGNPWGPVGESALVHGEKFTASGVLGQPVKLALIKGDVNNPPGGGSYEFCKLAGPKIALPGQAQVDSTGAFTYNFSWPPEANSGMYSICAYNTLDGLPVGNIDDGPFTVLSGGAPSVSVSVASLSAGQSITVTGKNWVPPQDVNVYIAACVDCDGPVVVAGTAHSSGLNTGTFSITFSIPANTTPGNYVAGANAHNGVLDVGPGGGKAVAISAAAEPTVAPTATAAQPTATAASNAGAGAENGDNAGATGNGVSLLVLILAGGGALLLVIALIVILAVALSRRGGKKTPPGGTSPGWGGSGPSYGPVSGAGAHIAPMAPPGGGSVQQNWETLPPGWGDQTPPTVSRGMPQGDDSPTRPNYSYIPDPAYPPAPPAMYPPPEGDTSTRPN